MQRLLTCFRRAVLLFATLMPTMGATVAGTVRITAASEHSRAHESGLADVIVWLQPEGEHAFPPAISEHVRLLQHNKMFHPHVLAIRTGTVVDFPNADPIFHNAFSNYDGQLFDVGLYPPGTNRSIRFRRPGVVRVFCNIHSSMSAVILVLDTPYFVNVSGDGQYKINNVTPGAYEAHVYDERAASEARIAVPVVIGGEQGEKVLPVIEISEHDYLRSVHKNKFGVDYAPGSDTNSYDGALK